MASRARVMWWLAGGVKVASVIGEKILRAVVRHAKAQASLRKPRSQRAEQWTCAAGTREPRRGERRRVPARIFVVSAVERPLYRHKPRLFSFVTWLRPNLLGSLYTFLRVFVCILPAMDSRAATPFPRKLYIDSCVYFRNTGTPDHKC